LKYNKTKEAERQLDLLAEANLKDGSLFSEWLHGKTGKPVGSDNQGWNAAMYILAYHSVKKKKALL
jgi:GH15 family glucan-1,4-alpha-glucosidase